MPNSRDPEELAALFAKAGEIASGVPEGLREVAFRRALDELLGSGSSTQVEVSAPERRRGTSHDAPEHTNRAERLIQLIDRTEGAHIAASGRVLEKALFVLRAAHNHGIEALTPGEIAKVLTDKFRERTSAPAVRMALGNDSAYTDRQVEGQGFVYRLMGPGERYLAEIEAGGGAPAPRPSRKRPTAKRTQSSPEVPEGKPASTRAERRSARASTGRPGPKKMVEDLISQGYFSEARDIGEIINFVQQKRGYRYKATDLSPALARLLREEKLDRERDAEGQYRYQRRA